MSALLEASLGASCTYDSAFVRQSILKLKPYVPGKPMEEVKRELQLPDDFSIFKLASNENLLGPSALAIEAMQKAANDVWLYPDDTCFNLKNALAAHWSLEAENFSLGNGSDEVIHFLGLAFLDAARGDEVIFGSPSFVQYKAVALHADCAFHAVSLTRDYRHDLRAMKAKVNARTRLIFIANCNNPTGSVVSKAEFEEFLQGLPPHVIVVLDEAYSEYLDEDADTPRGRDYIHNHNVVSLHTFSKAYALAGTRVGYGMARPDIIAFLNQVRGPFNVNMIAQAGAIAALGDQHHIEKSVQIVREGRAQFSAAFQRMGLEYVPSQGNFVFVNVGVDSQSLFTPLLQEGVIVRTGTPFGMSSWMRVTVGTPEMNVRFLGALEEVLGL